MTTQTLETSPNLKARLAGALYLIVIVGGFFAIGYVPAVIVVSGDAAATARNLLTHETLYRLGLMVHLVILVCNIALGVLLYDLFKVVNQKLALMALISSLVGTAIEGASLLIQFVPLILLQSSSYAGLLTAAQVQALAYLPFQLQSSSFNLNVIFFVLFFFLTAYLIVKAPFLPSFVGVLLFIGGACYLIDCVATVLAPAFAAHLFPYIQLPSLIGEASFCLWLLGMGVNVEKWKTRALAVA